MIFKIFLYILFGILPSLVWLFYYLRKDAHPEPRRMIIKVFLWGAVITIPVFFAQIGLSYLLNRINTNPVLISLIYWFLVIAFTEEIFKYLVVKIKVLKSADMDEPTDIVLYMIIAALGFASLENIIYLFTPVDGLSFEMLLSRTILVSFIRFIGATFLHALCSAVIGYALVISYCDEKNRLLETVLGITIAVLLHGVYNFSIMTLEGYLKVVVPALVIFTLACLVFSGFEKLKKIKSVTTLNCKQI